MGSGLYFDYCATTPIHPQVREAITSALEDIFGNPSSMHGFGKTAHKAIEKARLQVAAGIGASPEEIIFTSGATEANNLALSGVLRQMAPGKNHLVISAIEHHAVLHTADALNRDGFQLTILPVDKFGVVSSKDLDAAIKPETALVSILMVNNEVGTIQDISQLTKISKSKGALFHTDAVQALPYLDVDVNALGIDLLSLSAHKIYGPKGIGALFVRSGTSLTPLFYGGSQERKLRPGTENVPGIIGLGKAVELRTEHLEDCRSRLLDLRSVLVKGLRKTVPGCKINGPQDRISPHIISVSFPGIDGELLLFHLSEKGVAVSLGSACTSEELEPSHVLAAMGLPHTDIDGTLRISLGDFTTTAEIEELLDLIPAMIDKAKLE